MIEPLWLPDRPVIHALCRENKGHKFILTVNEIFRKRAWSIPMKNKSGKDMLIAFLQVFRSHTPANQQYPSQRLAKNFGTSEQKAALV